MIKRQSAERLSGWSTVRARDECAESAARECGA